MAIKVSTGTRQPILKRLKRLLPRRGRVKWLVAAVLIGPFLMLGLLWGFGLLLGTSIRIDVGLILLSIAAIIAALALYQAVQHWNAPNFAVTVNYNFRLTQPALSVGRYSFRLEVFYEVEEKGERQRIQQGTIEMLFRRKDHPELFEWCRNQIATQLTRHRELAAARYPNAQILLSPEPSVPELVASVENRA
jgi:hypothetical protein